MHEIADLRDVYCGIPMPMDDAPLVVEPSYPNAAGLMAIGRPQSEPDSDPAEWCVRSTFWSTWRHLDVAVVENLKTGKVRAIPAGRPHSLDAVLLTLGCSDAWGVEQEARAVQTLGSLVRHRQFKQYMLTGTFLESSKRSGVTYLFRRLRPTVAIAKDPKRDRLRTLCGMCMHPIAYYQGTWAGAMCPTDDVIAHLMLMRGDEALFWRRCNQHAPDKPLAGL